MVNIYIFPYRRSIGRTVKSPETFSLTRVTSPCRYHLPDGNSIRVFFFVMMLGFARALYIEFTRSMRLERLGQF